MICDARRAYHSIQSIVRQVFRQIRQICCAYEPLRCLDVKIWRYFVDSDNNDNDRIDYFTSCTCAWDNKQKKHSSLFRLLGKPKPVTSVKIVHATTKNVSTGEGSTTMTN